MTDNTKNGKEQNTETNEAHTIIPVTPVTPQTEKPPEITQTKFYIFTILMIVSGSINTIANKFQQNLYSLERKYSHPWFITTSMFIGESTCIIWYLFYKFNQRKGKEKKYLLDNDQPVTIKLKKPEIPIYLIALPAVCDFLATTLMCLGLTMMAGSVYQMLRGSVILFTSILSVYFLKRVLYRHHFLGISLVIVGLILVGLGALVEKGGKGAQTDLLGLLLVIIAQLFSSSQFIIEEKLMAVYSCHPLKLVGFEGAWGVLIYSCLMVIFYFSECPFTDPNIRDNICVLQDKEKGIYVIEDITLAFRQLGDNGVLLFMAILYTLSISLFNFVGINITKYVSAAARAVVDSVRTVFVWLFFLTMPFVPESTKEYWSWLQFTGFIVLIVGSITYNEIIEWPCLGFNQYTKRALKQKNEIKEGLLGLNRVEIKDLENDTAISPSEDSADESMHTIVNKSNLNKTDNSKV